MSTGYHMVPIKRLQPIIEREIAAREAADPHLSREQDGGLSVMGEELAAWSGGAPERFVRRLYVIRKGWDSHGLRQPRNGHWRASAAHRQILSDNGMLREAVRDAIDRGHTRLTAGFAYDFIVQEGLQRKVPAVRFETADEILTGLKLGHLWHTELEDLLPPELLPDDETYDHTCLECKAWIDWEGGALGVRVEMTKRNASSNRDGIYRYSWWSWCASCASRLLPIAEPGNNQVRTPGSRAAKLNVKLIRDLYARYVSENHSLVTLAEEVWESLGYKNQQTCQRSLGAAFRNNSLPIRTISQAKRLNKKTGRRAKYQGNLQDAQIRAAYELYWKRGLSFNDLGKMLYERFGYADYRTCATALCEGFKALGLPARDRVEASVLASTSSGLSPKDWRERSRRRKEAGLTVQGMKPRRQECAGETKYGKKCTRKALRTGGLYCQLHDPAMSDADRAKVEAQKRARVATIRAQMVDASDLAETIRYLLGPGGWTRHDVSKALRLSYTRIESLVSGDEPLMKPHVHQRCVEVLASHRLQVAA